ncbi:CLUMA_CG012792, isoform A [Clunio marinus]|uniref:CLUMA_CG012792, isoform A n=1 Tax=Clunio marinus TaxID=568069 RepID=A0A1J1IHR6_9DIPT|nr:CLUMA_CG012792, isoform A [Clunio marinus]
MNKTKERQINCLAFQQIHKQLTLNSLTQGTWGNKKDGEKSSHQPETQRRQHQQNNFKLLFISTSELYE